MSETGNPNPGGQDSGHGGAEQHPDVAHHAPKIVFGQEFKMWLTAKILLTCLVLGSIGVFLYHKVSHARAQEEAQNDRILKGIEGVPVLYGVTKDWFTKKDTDPGLKLTEENVKGLKLMIASGGDARTRSLPPQVGTLNYDNETMFIIKPRFQGELATMLKVKEKVIDANGYEKIVERPIKFGDKVKQGSVLALFWSQTLGVAKAALVDAICSLELSKDALDRQKAVYNEGALSFALLKQAERQVQSDSLSVLTAERTLRMWKLTDKEIDDIKEEAKMIIDTKKARDAAKEAERWARTEVIVPWFDRANPDRQLTILEKNTNIGDIVDNGNYATWLFRVADMSTLQIWAHPPEEFLPLIREGMKRPGGLTWEIRFQSEPDMPPYILRVDRISPSLEPNQHNPMVIGYLPNTDYKYLAGQFITATIHMPPEPDTVEIPTDALNEVKGQSFVFVKEKGKQNQYSLRRVAVVRRYADYTVIRSVLREQDTKFSAEEVKQGRYPLRSVSRGDEVVTVGVVELTTALDTAVTREFVKLSRQ